MAVVSGVGLPSVVWLLGRYALAVGVVLITRAFGWWSARGLFNRVRGR